VYARDNYATAARVIGEALAIGQSLDDVEAWPERIGAVTREQVQAAAEAVFAKPAVTSVLLGTGQVTATAEPGGGGSHPAAGAAIR
jgi:zinc protease